VPAGEYGIVQDKMGFHNEIFRHQRQQNLQ